MTTKASCPVCGEWFEFCCCEAHGHKADSADDVWFIGHRTCAGCGADVGPHALYAEPFDRTIRYGHEACLRVMVGKPARLRVMVGKPAPVIDGADRG